MTKTLYINISSIDDNLYNAIYSVASQDRQKRANKYINKEDSVRCIVSEAMFKYALSDTGRDISIIPEKDANGKPFIKNDNFKFNTSHAGRYVAISYAEDSEIGVDVEKIFIDSGRELVAKYYYTEAENEEIFKDGIEENNAMQFTQLWTMKESYLKYLGTEKNRPLASFTADRKNGVIIDQSGNIIEGVHLISFFPENNYCISVCSESDNVSFEEITADTLVKVLGIKI